MNFKVAVEVDEPLVVHVDLIKFPHYIIIVYYLKM